MHPVLIAVLASVFSIMATSLVSIALAPKLLKSIVHEAMSNHISVHHQKDIETAIALHTRGCVANGTIQEIRDAVLWLVIRQGGNPKELGLAKESFIHPS